MKTLDRESRFLIGQSVVIVYDRSFRDLYPHTFARFDGKSGTVVEKIEHGGRIIGVRLFKSGIVTLVDQKYLAELSRYISKASTTRSRRWNCA